MASILFHSDAKTILHCPIFSYPRQSSVSLAQTDTQSRSVLCYYVYSLY